MDRGADNDLYFISVPLGARLFGLRELIPVPVCLEKPRRPFRCRFLGDALVSLWITAQAVEIAAAALPEKLFWANVQYLPITIAPVAYLMLVLAHTGGDTRLRRRRMLLLLCVAPVALNALLWTDNFHGLIRQGIYLDSNGPVGCT